MKFLKMFLLLSWIVPEVNAVGRSDFKLVSQDFKDGGQMPTELTKVAAGRNISPQLSWSNAPAGTRSFVITCIDIHPIAHNWVHWMVIDIPSKVSSFGRNASGGKLPYGAKELENSFGLKGWGGPRPPAGTGIHKYVFTIYALNVPVIKPGEKRLSEHTLLSLLKGKVLAKATLTGTYQQD